MWGTNECGFNQLEFFKFALINVSGYFRYWNGKLVGAPTDSCFISNSTW